MNIAETFRRWFPRQTPEQGLQTWIAQLRAPDGERTHTLWEQIAAVKRLGTSASPQAKTFLESAYIPTVTSSWTTSEYGPYGPVTLDELYGYTYETYEYPNFRNPLRAHLSVFVRSGMSFDGQSSGVEGHQVIRQAIQQLMRDVPDSPSPNKL
jgi:hypothetical protein